MYVLIIIAFFSTVKKIKDILVEMIPFMKDIKSALNYQEANLTSFNETIRQLTANLDEHKNQTAAELAQLQTSLTNITHQLNDIHEDVAYILGPYTCGGTGGWRCVVYLNTTDPTSTCPSGWNITGYSTRTCGRVSTGQYVLTQPPSLSVEESIARSAEE